MGGSSTRPRPWILWKQKSILGEFQVGLDKLRLAQQRPTCVFLVPIAYSGLKPHAGAAREVAKVLEIRICHDLLVGDFDEVYESLDAVLRLARDVRRRGDAVAQLVSLNLEQRCCQIIIQRILPQHGLTADECGRLLKLLRDHEQAATIDPLLEAERYDQLVWRKLIDQLRNDELDAVVRSQELGINTQTIPGVLMVELYSLGNHEINSEFVRQIATELADNNPEVAEALEKVQHVGEEDHHFARRIDRMLATVLLAEALLEVTPSDYDAEIAVLDRRYRQMEAAARLPYPQRAETADLLSSQWTLDAAESQTRILRLFKPPRSRLGERMRWQDLRRRATTCLVALTAWRLTHEEGEISLATALKAAGIAQVPSDSYSAAGEPLKMKLAEEGLIVYSVGPDGDDDQGDPALSIGCE